MGWNECKHKKADDFSVMVNERRTWKCSCCGRQEPWGESWGYYGSMECKDCWTAAIDFVWCSDECRDKLAIKHNVDPTPRRGAKVGSVETRTKAPRQKRVAAWERKARNAGWLPPDKP